MVKMVKLRLNQVVDNAEIYVNADNVISVRDHGSNVVVKLSGGDSIGVEGPALNVILALNKPL